MEQIILNVMSQPEWKYPIFSYYFVMFLIISIIPSNLKLSTQLQSYINASNAKSNDDIMARTIIQKYISTPKNIRQGTITNYNIAVIPPSGVQINSPGTYFLSNNINFNAAITPTGVTICAIVINSSNVVLNLQGYQITQTNASNLDSVGIYITSNLSNVQVINGSMSGFGSYTITSFNSSNITIIKMKVSNQRCADVSFASAGIFIVGGTNVIISNSSVSNANVQSLSYAGIQLRFCMNSKIISSLVKNCVNNAGGCSGISALASKNIVFSDNEVSGINSGTILPKMSPGHTTLGIFLFLSSYVSVSNCNINNVHGSCDDSHAVSVFVCSSDIIVKNCDIYNITSGFATGTGAKATGVEIIMSYNTKIQDCVVKKVKVLKPQDLQCAGFSSSCALNTEFHNCLAEDIVTTGINTKGVGFGWAPDPRQTFIQPTFNAKFVKCYAKNVDIGFDMFYSIAGNIINCKTNNAKVDVLDITESRTLTCNECSECNPSTSSIIPNIGRDNIIL